MQTNVGMNWKTGYAYLFLDCFMTLRTDRGGLDLDKQFGIS